MPANRLRAISGAVLILLATGPATTRALAAGPGDFSVAVVPSDAAALADPAPRDGELTTAQVEAMVRRAVALIGGMAAVVPDTARLVLLKPNIGVSRTRRCGVITDDRVVRAVALLVHEAAPRARIVIGEAAGGWASPEYRDGTTEELWPQAWVDGFELAGHRETAAELRSRGVNIDCVDLNFDRAYTLTVPGGGLVAHEYDVAATIMDADVWINLPVAKTHGAKITCAMKNHFGLLPGNLYGWPKLRGTETHPPIPHTARVVDEAFVDLWTVTQVDLNVVDMITGSERGPFEETTRRQNIVLAGRDPVAVDLAAARLMGYNPDDLEFADLAWQRGRGPRWLERVTVLGAELAPLVQRFEKAGFSYDAHTEWHGQAIYGKGPRRWTLLGPLPRDHAFAPDEIAGLAPAPGQGGWSEVVWFGHDKIDLDRYYDDPVRCAVYGYAEFTMPRADSVRIWLGADERLQVWIDGEPLYDTDEHPELGRRRRHRLGMVRVPGYLEAGDHRLLVRVEQGRGRFDFSVNVCEPIDDERFAGNTYPGLRYRPAGEAEGRALSQMAGGRVTSMGPSDSHHEPERMVSMGSLRLAPHPTRAATQRGDTVTVEANLAPAGASMAEALAAAAGVTVAGVDLEQLEGNPFGMVPVGPERFLDLIMSNPYSQASSLPAVVDLLGVGYELSGGFSRAESLESVREWLLMGHVPVIGTQARWVPVTGYRAGADGAVELRLPEADGPRWHAVGEWYGDVPQMGRLKCPVAAAAPRVLPQGRGLAERVAAFALEAALTPQVFREVMWWGAKPAPAGLAAWDWSVIHWERLAPDERWAADGLNWSLLARMRSQHLEPLIADRRRSAELMRQLAASSERGYRELSVAAASYGEVVARLGELRDALPEDPRRRFGPGQAETLDVLREKWGLLRQARRAERRALQALSRFLGRGPLPPAQTDPLDHLAAGYRLYRTRIEGAEGVWELWIQGRDQKHHQPHGARPDRFEGEFCAPIPQEPGWTAVLTIDEGDAVGRVVEQPSEANQWQATLYVDSLPSWGGGDDVAFSVWAVPDSALAEGEGAAAGGDGR